MAYKNQKKNKTHIHNLHKNLRSYKHKKKKERLARKKGNINVQYSLEELEMLMKQQGLI